MPYVAGVAGNETRLSAGGLGWQEERKRLFFLKNILSRLPNYGRMVILAGQT